jgi:hypothetical protein
MTTQPNKAEIERVWRQAMKHATFFARGRLHVEDAESEAGMAVTMALQNWDPSKGATFATYVRRLLDWGILRKIQRDSRYESMPEEYWEAVPARAASDPSTLDHVDNYFADVKQAVRGGATVETVSQMAGMAKRRAKRFIETVNKETKAA